MIGRVICILVLALWVMASVALAQGEQKAIDLPFDSFHVIYDYTLNVPVYVTWSVTPSDLGQVKRKASWTFRQDRRVPAPRATSSDYTHSGYQRGHMCPAADRSASIAAMKETFTMSNICPQLPALNTGAWSSVEVRTRAIARRNGGVIVRCAPLFFACDTIRIGKHRVAVPHAFVKAVYAPDGVTLLGFGMFNNQ